MTLSRDEVVLLALSAAAGFFAAASAVRAGPRKMVIAHGTLPLAAAAAAATIAVPAPNLTGHRLWDMALRALIVVACSLGGGAMDRRALLGVSVAAVAIAGASGPGLVAAAALGGSVAIVATGLRFRRPKAAAGALVGAALSHAGPADARSMVAAAACLLFIGVVTAGRARWGRLALAVPIGVLTIAGAAYATVAIQARTHLTEGVSRARAALAEVTGPDARRAESDFATASREFSTASDILAGGLAKPMGYVPGAAQNARALEVMSRVGQDLSRAGSDAVASRDLAHLRVSNGRVDLEQMRRLTGPADRVVATLDSSRLRLTTAASDLLASPVTGPLRRLTARVEEAATKAHELREALGVAPALLGATKPRTYFLAIQNPAEARASGGIIGDFGVITVTDGKLALAREGHDDVLNATGNPAARVLKGPRDYLARYERFGPEQTWQNVTLSPDFSSVGQVISQLFPQSGGQPIDGVISVDPEALAALLGVTGAVQVPSWPAPISKDNVAAILLHDQYLVLAGNARFQFAADVVAAVFHKIETGQLPDVRSLGRALAPAIAAKHLLLYSPDPTEERIFRELNATGELQHAAEDTLAVVTQNSSGNKIDWYLHRTIDDHLTVDTVTGAVDATVTIALRNEAPATGLPPIVIGGFGDQPTAPGQNRTWLSVYTGLELVDARANGAPVSMQRELELGRTVLSQFLTLDPGATLTVVLHLRGVITPAAAYSLYLRAQPTVTPDEVSVEVNGRLPLRWNLSRDTVVTP